MTTIRIGIAALMATLLGTAPARGQSPAEQAQEKRALGFVEALHTADASRLLDYMQSNWVSAEDEADREQRWKAFSRAVITDHADVQVTGVTVDRPGELTVIARDPDGPTLNFVFEFEAEPPYRIVSMSLEADAGPPGAELPDLRLADDIDRDGIRAALAAWFDELAANDLFSGTALVAWKGEPVFQGAWGLASKRWNVSNTTQTRFDLGSINKSFTKIAVGQLLLAGKLSLGDVIGKFLPDYPNEKVRQRVTIRQLLDHSAGLGDIFTDEFFASDKAQYRQPKDFFWLFAHKDSEFEPGTRHAYSNAGFMVLGAIIAAVSGVPYDDYVTRHIFEPAGMDHAGFFAHDEPVENVAEGYTRQGSDDEEPAVRSNVLMLPVKGNSAGSAQATVLDLLRFDNALREYRLLPYEYTQWYFGGAEPTAEASSAPPAGRATAAIGIAGGAPGVSASLESDGNLAVIVLSNYDPPITEQIARLLTPPLRHALKAGP